MLSKHIPKQLHTNVLERGDLLQLESKLVKLLFCSTELGEVFSLDMRLHIRFVEPFNALLRLKQLIDRYL